MKVLGLLLLIMVLVPIASADDTDWVAVGDMIVPRAAVVEPGVDIKGIKKVGVRLWPNGIIRYQFASNVSESQRRLFLNSCAGMGEYADVQCLPRRSQDQNYVIVQGTSDNVCGSSYLGVYGGGQPLKIRCWRSRTIQHELMHAFGMTHEHNRIDRDNYIQVVWNNIDPAIQYAFRKISAGGASHTLSYYDFDSLLHYDSRSGSANGGIVMYRKDLGPNNGFITQSNVMSYGDHYFLYALYGGVKP